MKKTLNVRITKDSKKVTIKFPTNGQIIDMEAMLSGLSFSILKPNSRAHKIVESMGFFASTSEELLKEHGLDNANWLDLSYVEVAPFVSTYFNEIKPWIDSVYKELDEVYEEIKEKREEVEKVIEKK